MTTFDSTLVKPVELRMPGLQLRSFALYRPAADRSVCEAHSRVWSKAVLFLDGAAGGDDPERPAAEAGTLVVLPPGQRAGGFAAAVRLPFCFVLEFRLDDEVQRPAVTCTVPRADLLQAKEQIAYLLRLQAEPGEGNGWEIALVMLHLLMALLRAAGWIGAAPAANRTAGDSAMHRLLLTMPLEAPLQQIVQRSGYQRDHLNRLLKKETGLTLGQFRAQRRLDRAKELLAQGVKVGDVAGEIGLPDQSYFARWFRRQTGLSPSHWLEAGAERSAVDLALCG